MPTYSPLFRFFCQAVGCIALDAVEAFVNDPTYAKYRKARQDGSISRFHKIDDIDLAGSIPYLQKG